MKTVTEPTPRPVFCVIDHLWRDLAVADDAVAGRFTHAGSTEALGLTVDWLRQIGDDEEWRIEWVKLYEGMDLGHAFATTGDRRYLETWEDLVTSFCDQVPVGYDTSDVTARRLQNWTYAWSRFASAPGWDGLRPGLATRLVERIGADADHVAANLTPERNHRTMELYALFIVGLAFPDVDCEGRRVDDAIAELHRNLQTDVWDDGVHRECSTDYHMIVLRSFLGTIANARRVGRRLPDGFVERVGLACDFALHVQRPDGLTPSFSDGDVGDYRRLLGLGADLLEREDLRWAATLGDAGRAPSQRNVSFPVGGYHVQRSGWGDRERDYGDERFCLFDCGPLGDGGHGHYDQLGVEIHAGGRTLVCDPGRYTYADDADGWRHHFKGTAAHNTVMIDGLDQTPYRRGRPKQPSVATLVGRWTADGIDLLTGQVRSVSHEVVHTRDLAFVDDDLWLIVDHLEAAGPHEYVARWHLTEQAQGFVRRAMSPEGTTVNAPGLTLVVGAGPDVTIDDGWVAPTYGLRLPAPVVTARLDGADVACIVTAIVPGERAVRLTTQYADVGAWRGTITVDGSEHHVGWSTARGGTRTLEHRVPV